MAIAPLKVILFLLGGTVAAGTTAYVAGVFDGYLGREPVNAAAIDATAPKVAELPPAQADAKPAPQEPAAADVAAPPAAPTEKSAAEATEAAAPQQPAAPSDSASETSAAGNADAPADASAPAAPATEEQPQEMAALSQDQPSEGKATADVQAPSFDIVRVEADGSIVIAGRAAANSKVEAVIGSRIIGSTTAGADGNFAIVLDEPLKPGDYQIVLRSTTPDNVVATSMETAVVSIPDSKDGQVLALVQEPGKPAELITVPEPTAPQEEIPEATAKPQEPASPAEAAGENQADEPAMTAPQPAQDAASTEQRPTEPAAAPGEAASDQPAASEPAAGGEQAAAAPAPVTDEPDQASKQDRVGPKVTVEAVEIEGRRIFIAGSADPGRLVRGYANDILLGDSKTSPAGRFLIEAERDLPVGDYVIRVDALEKDGAKVVARAAVPFEREPGENIAAVAPPAAADQAKPAATAAEKAAPAGARDNAAASPDGASIETPLAAAPEPSKAPATASAPDQPEAAASDADATPPAAESAAAEALAPKLRSVDSAVIIRRGDTLWRISRRVYGRGVRYSTIYLANQDQIRDPDLILPGQVFKVPERTTEGEAADISKMGEQAVSPSAQQ